MSESFEDALKAMNERLAPQGRERRERNIQTLLQAGATSLERTRALCVDRHVSAKVRSIACWALARLRDKEAIPSLLRALNDDDPTVRGESAQALALLDDDATAVEPLIRTLMHDSSLDVRRSAALSLGMIGDVAALNPLIAVLSDPEESPSVRGDCAEALGELGEKAALMPLLVALRDPSAEVRFFAAFGLGLIGDPSALPALEHMATTDDGIAEGWGPVRDEASDAIDAIRARSQELSRDE